MGLRVRAGLGYGGITCVLQTQFFSFILFFYSQCEIYTTFIIDFLLVQTSPKETESICQFINK